MTKLGIDTYDRKNFLLSASGKRVNLIHQDDRRVKLRKQLDKFVFYKSFSLPLPTTVVDKFSVIGNMRYSSRG